jgi:hypothetical protein
MADVAPKLKEVLQDKDSRNVIRGVLAAVFLHAKMSDGDLPTPANISRCFTGADSFMDEWLKRSK